MIDHWTRSGKTLSLLQTLVPPLGLWQARLGVSPHSVTPLAWSLVGATPWLLTPDYGPGLCGLGLYSVKADVLSSPKMPWPCELSPLLSKLSWLDFALKWMWSVWGGSDSLEDIWCLPSVHQINTLIGWQDPVLKCPVLKGKLAKG